MQMIKINREKGYYNATVRFPELSPLLQTLGVRVSFVAQ